MKRYLIGLFFLLSSFLCFGQRGKNFNLSDTISFVKISEPMAVPLLTLLKGEIVDTLIKSESCLVRNVSDSMTSYFVIKKSGDDFWKYEVISGSNKDEEKFDQFTPPAPKGSFSKSSVKKISKYQFQNAPDSFLIINFFHHEGYNTGSGFDWRQSGLLIINPATMTVVTITDNSRYENWPYGNGLEATNSGMVRFFEQQISFENGLLKVLVDGRTDVYVYKGGFFIRKH